MQTNKILIIALVILAAFYLFKYLAQKKNENFIMPQYNDIGHPAVSSGDSYATLGSSCTSCSERPSLSGIMNS